MNRDEAILAMGGRSLESIGLTVCTLSISVIFVLLSMMPNTGSRTDLNLGGRFMKGNYEKQYQRNGLVKAHIAPY